MKKALAACAVALIVGVLVPVGVSPAGADPASASAAAAFGANLDLNGAPVVDRGGLAQATAPPTEDDGPNELILVPAGNIAVSGTATGEANAHLASEVPSSMTQVPQTVAGPYNVRGVGLVENLGVLFGAAPLQIPLIGASAVRGEAVGVCRGGVARYGAKSEIIDLNVGGTDVPLNGPVTDLIDTLNGVLAPLNALISIERNLVAETPTGAAVTALRVTVLGAGGTPLLDLQVGRAEVSGLVCGAGVPECSDTQDNDGDGVIDSQDPGCTGPNDDDERNQCTDGIDNADPEDTLVDFGSDPGCSSPEDNDETDGGGGGGDDDDGVGGGALARTGGPLSSTAPVAAGFAVLALGALALRRRSNA